MYACLPDYVASNAANTIVCNETSWTLTNLSCSLGIINLFSLHCDFNFYAEFAGVHLVPPSPPWIIQISKLPR